MIVPIQPSVVADAAAHLQELLDAMHVGRSVRTPDEFRADLESIHVAVCVLRLVTPSGDRTPDRDPTNTAA